MEDVVENLETLENVVQRDWVTMAVTAVIILAITALVSYLVTRFIRNLLNKDDSLLPSNSIFLNLTRAGIWIAGICIMLTTCFNINVSAIIAALGVGGIAISLGFQDTISNLIGGLQVSLNKTFEPGDRIQVGADTGIVKDVTWRHTTLTTTEGNTVIIPNSLINKSTLIHLADITTVRIPFSLDKSIIDLDKAQASLETACTKALRSKKNSGKFEPFIAKAPVVSFSEFGDFGTQGTILVYVSDFDKQGEARKRVIQAIACYNHSAKATE